MQRNDSENESENFSAAGISSVGAVGFIDLRHAECTKSTEQIRRHRIPTGISTQFDQAGCFKRSY